MIDDLDRTLARLLVLEVTDLEEGRVSFRAPDADFKPVPPAVNLFLYDVRENHDLRDNEWQVERTGDLVTRRRPPVRVDCSYLITAYFGTDDDQDNVIGEHGLLSQVMTVLLRYPTLPQAVLQGSLADQAFAPPPTAVLQPGRLQSLGEFWQALGGKPKAALNYTVTIPVFAHEPVDLGPPVTSKTEKARLPEEGEVFAA